MSKSRGLVYAGIIGLFLLLALFAVARTSASRASNAEHPVHVRWLLSHRPTEVFARATRVFADELLKETGGRLVLDVVAPQDLGYASGDIPNADVLRYLAEDKVELATTYTVALGNADQTLWSVNLPFLVPDYVAANRFLDSAAGNAILVTIDSKTNTHALAFTMSGGFRIIASKETIRTPADLKGKHIATSGGPVAAATLTTLGAIPVPTDLEGASHTFDPKTVDGVETTYSRLASVVGAGSAYTKNIAETNHSLFLTVILASNAFYDSLTPADQGALRNAALAAARVEREDSAALGDRTKAVLKAGGTAITEFSPEERRVMKDASRTVYTQFESMFGTDLMRALTQ